VCSAGACTGGGALSCIDSNPCTDDSCDPAEGCKHLPNALPCDDGNPCTTQDLCNAGKCTGGGILPCDDGNLCTDDKCEPATGCVHTHNAVPCDDGDVCTTGDLCGAGVCAGQGALDCDDGNLCTDDSCVSGVGCLFDGNAAACDDGNACTTVDACAAGACTGTVPLDCDDANSCTAQSCDQKAGCKYQPEPDGIPCSFPGSCQGTCKAGVCVETAVEICTTKDDDDCDGQVNEGCIYSSCSELLNLNPTAASGKHTIDPDAGGPTAPFEVVCDMTSDGGGWTLIGVASNLSSRQWTSVSVFTDATTFGSIDDLTLNFKSPAWKNIKGSDFLIATSEYSIGYRNLMAAQSFGDFVAGNWPGGCASSWLHGTPEYTENLTAEEAKLFAFTLRGWDNNAECFPNSNENSAISLTAATCCWVNGIGNNTCCQPQWISHDQSLLKKERLVAVGCAPGNWPCNAQGVYVNDGYECYDTSCKVPWARMYVR